MKTKTQSINVGSSSILMIFVTLCLICFASLSLISANSDYKLSQKFAQKTKAFYQASNEAEKSIASIDKTLSEASNLADENAYFLSVGDSISFYIPINEQQSLYVNLLTQYPDSTQKMLYRIENYKVETLNPPDVDTSIKFFTP